MGPLVAKVELEKVAREILFDPHRVYFDMHTNTEWKTFEVALSADEVSLWSIGYETLYYAGLSRYSLTLAT